MGSAHYDGAMAPRQTFRSTQQTSGPDDGATLRIQVVVFALVGAAFTSVYVPQPVLPILQAEFHTTPGGAALSISAVIAGISVASLPSGWLADHVPLRRLVASGGTAVALCCILAAATSSYPLLVAARFVQGLFVPALTTCVAAYLARNLNALRLDVAMGAYVSATVAGGLGGRLLGGWIHTPLHWRYAFVTTAVLVALASVAAVRLLPEDSNVRAQARSSQGYLELLREPHLGAVFLTAAGAFCAFSSVFSFFPFYLAAQPLALSTSIITSLYLTYVVGIVMGPLAGRMAQRAGSGATLVAASALFALALVGTLFEHLVLIVPSLLGVCAGFFAMHAAAVGALNRRVTGSRGRANALYMLCYYLGGAAGIASSGAAFAHGGWQAVVLLNIAVLVVPFGTGVALSRSARVARAEETR